MKLSDLFDAVRDTALRLLPHRAPTGLFPIGQPGRDAPVLVSGNYTLTVRRLRRTLRGTDVWLVVANSNGINVWCAAGGGHLTHHDVIAAIRTSGISERVDHRELVLPQLAATGVERHRIDDATGWNSKWGPADMKHLPGYLERGRRVLREERRVRFPRKDRAEMALAWAFPIATLAAPVALLAAGWHAGIAVAVVVAVAAFGLFELAPELDFRRYRWLVSGGAGVSSALAGTGALVAFGPSSTAGLVSVVAAAVTTTVILRLDFEGSTPLYASTIPAVGVIELVRERCRGAGDCILVCPKDVFALDGHSRTVGIARPEECMRCGACIVQCPHDALRFRYEDGRIAGPEILRTTRLNLAGQRAVRIEPEPGHGATAPS